MEYRTYPVTIEYLESYIPPRCRKPRYREAKKTYKPRVRVISKEEAPVAFILSDYGHSHEGRVKVRLYKGRFYMLETSQYYIRDKKDHFGDGEFFGWRPTTADRLKLNCWHHGEYEKQRATYRKEASSRLIIDGLVWIECGEPMYVINTFGLGHNHGGTALFVETRYNPNISKDRYFNALQGDQAVAEMNRIAERRGDTKSVGRYGKMIEILIPERVKRNPQKEHGEGNAFINTINTITESADSAAEAGLLAILTAAK